MSTTIIDLKSPTTGTTTFGADQTSQPFEVEKPGFYHLQYIPITPLTYIPVLRFLSYDGYSVGFIDQTGSTTIPTPLNRVYLQAGTYIIDTGTPALSINTYATKIRLVRENLNSVSNF